MFELNQTQHKIMRKAWTKDTFTRQELSEEMDVNKSTISRNIQDLIDRNIIVYCGEKLPGETGGRKTQLMKLNKEFYLIIGFAIVNERITYTISNLKGEIISKEVVNGDFRGQSFLKTIEDIITTILKKHNNIIAICISMSGIINSKDGIIVRSDRLELKNFNLKKCIENRFNIFTFIENDANAGVASYLFSLKHKYSNLVYFMFLFPSKIVKFGAVSAGIVINKQVYRGSFSAAGELDEPDISGDKLFSINEANRLYDTSKEARIEIESMSDEITQRIAISSSLLDPDYIILGGDINQFSKEIKNLIEQKTLTYLERTKDSGFILIDNGGMTTIANGGVVSFLNSLMNNFSNAKRVFSFK
jgi:predicted NBD/HSP70 family sugar kinase